jgi:hypothetical protein
MCSKDVTEKALNKAYSFQVGKLFENLFNALIVAQNNEQKVGVATEKFQNGMRYAKDALVISRKAEGIE